MHSFELRESTEDPPGSRLDMWFVGLSFVVLGACIYVAEGATRKQTHF